MGTPDWRIASGGRQTQIAPDGVTEAAGPAWTGRFERMTFGAGFHMHLGELDIDAASELNVVGGDGGPTPISVYTLLGGRAVISMPGWPDLPLTPGEAILFLPQERRAVFRLPGPQVLRFFSVALPRELLISLLDGEISPALAPLVEGERRVTVVKQRPLGPAVRGLIADLGSPGGAGALQRLHREAVAIRLLTEMVEAERAQALPGLDLTARETAAIRAARGLLLADLRDAPSAAILAEAAGVGLRRFLRAFEAVHGASPAQLLRTERLDQARRLLETGELSLKEVAWRVGYAHVSNFVTAFADHFGLPPRQFLRRD